MLLEGLNTRIRTRLSSIFDAILGRFDLTPKQTETAPPLRGDAWASATVTTITTSPVKRKAKTTRSRPRKSRFDKSEITTARKLAEKTANTPMPKIVGRPVKHSKLFKEVVAVHIPSKRVERYGSITGAANALNTDKGLIGKVLRGINVTHAERVWAYACPRVSTPRKKHV